MSNLKPASTIDSPVLTINQAMDMPEFAEGAKARREGKGVIDNPYSISNVSEKRLIPSVDWRPQYENRFHAWMFGYNE